MLEWPKSAWGHGRRPHYPPTHTHAHRRQMMYEKTLAAQQAVLSGLTDEVTR